MAQTAIVGNPAEQTLARQCQHDGLPWFAQNYRFHALRKYEIDLCFPDYKVGCEIQGGVWRRNGGAHSSPLMILRDMSKSNLLVMEGWAVLRYTPLEVTDGTAVDGLKVLLRQKGWVK